MTKMKALILGNVIYVITTTVSILTFGWGHGLILIGILILFGWGMNIENKYIN